MKSGIFIWTLIILVLLFFFYLLPLPIRNEYAVTWALIGGLVCFVLLLLFFSSREDNSPVLVLQFPLYLCSIFLFGGLFLYFTSKAVEYEFDHNYEVVMGKLYLNEHTEPKAGAETKVHIDYNIDGRKKRFIHAYITWRFFDLKALNSNIPVVYSKDNPDLARMILGKEDRVKYGIDFTDTLNKTQQKMVRLFDTYVQYFNRDYDAVVFDFKGREYSDEDIYGALKHLEPAVSTIKSGSGKFFRTFFMLLSGIFLIIKLYSKFKK